MLDPRSSFLVSIAAVVIVVSTASAQSTQDVSPPPQSQSSVAPKLLFDDEFDGDQLNLKSWYRCFEWANEDTGCGYGPPYNLEWYLEENVSVSGGFLNLTAERHRVSKDFPYTSGIIESGGVNCGPPACNPPRKLPPGFAFQYGYMEMRAKFPPGHGMWPAFWLLPTDGSWPPEIDAMEWQGGTPTIDYATIHWRDHHGSLHHDGTAYDTGLRLSAGYHTFGLDWQPDKVVWYFDNTPIKTFTKAAVIPHKPMYVIVELAVGGWISFPNKHTHFPATMLVDYVRVWDHKP